MRRSILGSTEAAFTGVKAKTSETWEHKMQAHRITKVPPARAAVLSARAATMDRSREEALLIERWAAADSARTMDDPDWDNSQDQSDIASLARPRHAYDS